MKYTIVLLTINLLYYNCNQAPKETPSLSGSAYSLRIDSQKVKIKHTAAIAANYNYSTPSINTGNITPAQLISFANTLIGTPYKYASTDPSVGFDCSGFITYVFNHFNIAVPRSSKDFTNVPRSVPLKDAKPGDLILFTGTDSTIPEVGHMGIITSAQANDVKFIHSTSGKANGVTITPLNSYYMGRFVKIIRVFKHIEG
jgi:cell wall-associated NlpC family hydrolase